MGKWKNRGKNRRHRRLHSAWSWDRPRDGPSFAGSTSSSSCRARSRATLRRTSSRRPRSPDSSSSRRRTSRRRIRRGSRGSWLRLSCVVILVVFESANHGVRQWGFMMHAGTTGSVRQGAVFGVVVVPRGTFGTDLGQSVEVVVRRGRRGEPLEGLGVPRVVASRVPCLLY